MKRTLIGLAALALATSAFAQVSTATKESGKAVAEGTREAGDDMKAAVESQPNKSVDRSKAKLHKASKHHHAHRAKEAAKDTVK